MVAPRRLKPGDKVAAVSLSWGGPGAVPHRYQIGKRQLQDVFDLEVVETRHALEDPRWLHQNPRARADDLMEAFSDTSVQAIFSTIGGDDSIRIVPHLDFDVIKNNPKILLGYSDTTVTHLACLRAGFVSFYGPAMMTGFAENCGMFPYVVSSIRNTLFSSDPVGVVEPNSGGWTAEKLDWADPQNQTRRRKLNRPEGWRFLQGRGVTRGHLVGGCLEALEWLKGTPLWPGPKAWEGAILFLETSEGAPPPITVARALRGYAAMGILQELSGILFGRPGGKVPPKDFEKYDRAILQAVADEQGLRDLPIVTRMDFGHTDPVFVLPYGIAAQIDCERQEFSITESAVRD